MEKVSVWDLPDVGEGQLPSHIQLQRTRVYCNPDAPTHVRFCIYTYVCIHMSVNCSWLIKFVF